MDFEGYFVKKKFIIKEIAFFNYFLNTYENFFIKTKNIIRNIFDTSILAEPINRIKCQLENHTDNKHCALFKVQKLSLICDFKQETLI